LLCAAGMLGFELWRDREKPVPEEEQPQFEPKVMAVLAAVCVWTAVYYLVFDDLGYVLATAIYLLPMMAYFHPGKWIANVFSAVFFAGLTYWLFKTLDVNLPQGVLPF
jgi:putative tricarboxylic transport membrane protein